MCNSHLSVLQEMIKIRSQVGIENEQELAEYIHGFLDSLNIDVRKIYSQEGRVNLIASVKFNESGPKIILNGHMDTKPAYQSEEEKKKWKTDPFSGEVINGNIYGRGACDMKAGLAAFLCTIKNLVLDSKPKIGELEIQFVADEEMGSNNGMKYLSESYNLPLNADLAIVAEPTNNYLCKSELGNLWIKLEIKTDGGHAGLAFNHENAIDKTYKFVNEIERYIKDYRNKNMKANDIYDGLHQVNIGRISGGSHPGTVPNNCEAIIDLRIKPWEDRDLLYKEIEEISKRIMNESYHTSIRIEKYSTGGYPPCESKGNEYTERLFSLNRQLNAVENYAGFFGGSDAYYLMNKEVNTIIFGPGSLEQAHAINEYVNIKQYYQYIDVLTQFLIDCFAQE